MDLGASRAAGERSVSVGGDVVGSLIVTGDNNTINLLVGSPAGARIERLAEGDLPGRTLRRAPVPVPPSFANSVDREDEAQAILDAAAPGAPVNVTGARDIGKTWAILRALNSEDPARAGGALYTDAPGPLDDVMQNLFEAWYECDPPIKRSTSQLRRDLRDVCGLVALDSVELERDGAQKLALMVPGCALVIASQERVLWDGTSVAIGGLKGEYALAVVEQEFGRALSPDEQDGARRVCVALDGHPFRIREAIAAARESGRSIEELASELNAPDPNAILVLDKLKAAGVGGRRLVAPLALVGNATLGREHLRAIADVPDFDAALSSSLRRHDAQAHSPRYSIGTTLGSAQMNTEPAGERALAHFTNWADEMRTEPSELLTEAPALLALLRWAVDSGRLDPAIRLGRAVDHALALGRRFGAWAQVLEIVLAAARGTGDRDAEAWALHQLGTRAICLGDLATGSAMLSEAAEMRRRLGDHEAAELSAHNLAITRRSGWFTRWIRGNYVLLGLALVVLIGAVGAVALSGGNVPHPGQGPPSSSTSRSSTTSSSRTSHSQTSGGTASGVVTRPKLSVTVSGNGSVQIGEGGTLCHPNCVLRFDAGSVVPLTATPDKGSLFTSWLGACSGPKPLCNVTMKADQEVAAAFNAPVELIVAVAGGSVTSMPPGISCPAACRAFFLPGTPVTLTADGAAYWTGASGCPQPPPSTPTSGSGTQSGGSQTAPPSSTTSAASTPAPRSVMCDVTLQGPQAAVVAVNVAR